MKKAIIFIGLILMGIVGFAQDSTNPSLLRTSKAVKALNTVPYAQLAFKDSAITVALTEDTWALVANADSSLWTATVARTTSAGDSVTISVAGDYMSSFSLSYLATADDTIHAMVYKNDAATVPTGRVLSIGAEICNIAFTGLLPNLVAGDDLKPMIQNSNNGDDAVVIDGVWTLWLIRYD